MSFQLFVVLDNYQKQFVWDVTRNLQILSKSKNVLGKALGLTKNFWGSYSICNENFIELIYDEMFQMLLAFVLKKM